MWIFFISLIRRSPWAHRREWALIISRSDELYQSPLANPKQHKKPMDNSSDQQSWRFLFAKHKRTSIIGPNHFIFSTWHYWPKPLQKETHHWPSSRRIEIIKNNILANNKRIIYCRYQILNSNSLKKLHSLSQQPSIFYIRDEEELMGLTSSRVRWFYPKLFIKLFMRLLASHSRRHVKIVFFCYWTGDVLDVGQTRRAAHQNVAEEKFETASWHGDLEYIICIQARPHFKVQRQTYEASYAIGPPRWFELWGCGWGWAITI